jgi:hypothetical protein
VIISLTGKEAVRGKIKKPPGGGSVPSFSRFSRAYRFPNGMALAPLRKLKGCRAGDRANSLTATLDSKYFFAGTTFILAFGWNIVKNREAILSVPGRRHDFPARASSISAALNR